MRQAQVLSDEQSNVRLLGLRIAVEALRTTQLDCGLGVFMKVTKGTTQPNWGNSVFMREH